jgi:hypothetical protein
MLWQRFGRCARDLSLQGTAILFVEKEYIDHLKNVKKKRKRNASGIKIEPGASSTAKRQRTAVAEQLINVDEDPSHSDNELSKNDEVQAADEDDEQEPEEDGDAEEGRVPKMKRGKSKKSKIDPEIFDVINAETRGIGCRRQPFLRKFDNSNSSTSCLLSISFLNVLQFLYILNAIQMVVRAVIQLQLWFAATSIILSLLRCIHQL